MLIKKSLMMSAVGLLLLSLTTLSWAEDINLTLKADKSHTGANGTVILNGENLKIDAEGLHPNGVYTAWFVNMKPKKHETGEGTSPYMFKTDANGNGTYESRLAGSPFGKWEVLMIVLHPTGDPKDMKNMVGALSAMIPKNS